MSDSDNKIVFSSFGFKYGIPENVNYVFDVRFLPNPYYVIELRKFSGKDKEIKDFLFSCEETQKLVLNFIGFLDYIIPVFMKSGRSINIAVGCTGGRHRSVTFAELLFFHYKEKIQFPLSDGFYELVLNHRDISIEGNE